MPLGADNVIQEATGTTSPVTLPSGTTAGNTVIVVKGDNGATSPTGFTLAGNQAGFVSVHYKSDVADAENSWTISLTAAGRWYAFEVSGLDSVLPVDVTAGLTNNVVSGSAVSTGTTALNAGLYTLALAAFSLNNTGSLAGWSNAFEEVTNTAGSSTAYGLAVARLFESSTTRTFTTSSTLTTTGAPTVYGLMVVLRAADSPIVAPLAGLFGFEQATHGGAAASGSASMFGAPAAPTGTWGTTYQILAAAARNSSYGLRIVKSAATGHVYAGTYSSKAAVVGMNTRVVSATGTVVVAEFATAGGQLLYDATATKFGVRCTATGTASWQPGTTALNTFVWVEMRAKTSTSTYHVDWRIETATDTYTEQTAAEQTGQTAANMISVYLGGNVSQTMTADFDDVVISAFYPAYPLGPHQVKLLTVDPAGTPTVSGTAANFKVITANGTIGAWDATGARNAVDEVPVNISATADAVAQVTAAATEYMEFPMADPTLAADEYINGVRMLSAIGSGTGAGAGDLAIRGYDGTTETALATVSQLTPGSPTAITSTVPLWRCAMWQSTNGWTLAELAAAVIRAGFSGDATPDMWLHAAYLEYAVGKTRTRQLFGDFATVEEDPTRLGVMSITVTAPSGGDATLYYEDNTVPSTVPVPTETTVTQQIDSETSADANYIAFYPPPEGVPDA